MNDLIIPPPTPQPDKDASARRPIEIIVDRRGRRRRPIGYGLALALVGLAAVLGARMYAPERPGPSMQHVEAPPVQRTTLAPLDETTQRRIVALQDEVRELRTKLDEVEKRQKAEVPVAQTSSSNGGAEGKAEPAPDAQKPPAATGLTVARATRDERAATVAPPAQRIAPSPKILNGYRVRDVFHGAALIESRRGMTSVEPGEVLPGAGRVLAIQKRGRRWVVATESGDITGDARGQARAQSPHRRHSDRELYGFIPAPFAPPPFMPF